MLRQLIRNVEASNPRTRSLTVTSRDEKNSHYRRPQVKVIDPKLAFSANELSSCFRKPSILVLTFPVAPSDNRLEPEILLRNLLALLEPLCNDIAVITGTIRSELSHRAYVTYVDHANTEKRHPVVRMLHYMLTQIRLAYALFHVPRRFNIVIFFVGGTALVVPMLIARAMGKVCVVIATGSGKQGAKYIYETAYAGHWGCVFSLAIGILEKLNYLLAHRIIVYSSSLVETLGLHLCRGRVIAPGVRFVDMKVFRPHNMFADRPYRIGFAGRFSAEKGILQFLHSVVLLHKMEKELLIEIVGSGPLSSLVETFVSQFQLDGVVHLTNWIPHDQMPGFLNRLRLLVLPSLTEGLPNVLLEALASGTPVLGTPVGAIPDIIRHGETGFLIRSTLPQDMAMAIKEAVRSPALADISDNCTRLARAKFGFEAALKRYERILDDCLSLCRK